MELHRVNFSNDNNTFEKTSLIENDKIREHKEYLSNCYGIELNSKMETLALTYWILKKHKNPIWSKFIIASSRKPISNGVTDIIKLLCKKFEN